MESRESQPSVKSVVVAPLYQRREVENVEQQNIQPQEEEEAEEEEWMPDPNFSLANLNQKMRENDMRFEYDSASKSKQAELPEGADA